MPSYQPTPALQQLLRARASQVAMLAAGDASVLAAEPEEQLEELAQAASSEGAGLARWLTAQLLRTLQQQHQFASFEPSLRETLEATYAKSVATLASLHRTITDPSKLAAQAKQIASAEQAELLRALAGLRLGPAVVCAEYTPEMQLQMLGLDWLQLKAPLLDLGCGEHARLVKHCRDLGIEAIGVERHGGGEHVIVADWLDYEPAPSSFATIVSHQAFSLHFLHHHLAAGDTAYRYARKYMALLAALKPGGAFVYVPGLPFIEEHLTGFRVTRTPVPEPARSALRAAFRRSVGAGGATGANGANGANKTDVAYAAQVTRSA